MQMIKFEHTIFALPFALISVILAARNSSRGLNVWIITWVVLSMVGARSAAMSFNRLTDADIDARNPRTSGRHIPAGLLTKGHVLLFLTASIALFELASWKLNSLCFELSPIALLFVLGYSYTKRFTSLCHLFLGFAIGIAPIGAWLAVTGAISPPALLLGATVMLWIGGFDIIYSLQDYEVDVSSKLFSLPKRIGKAGALTVSRIMHLGAVVCLTAVGVLTGLHFIYYAGVLVVSALITYEQSLVRPDDLTRVDLAFFTLNGWVSISLFAFVLLDTMLLR
jgi:4-hydroxybenzoate polyprenyltransferase